MVSVSVFKNLLSSVCSTTTVRITFVGYSVESLIFMYGCLSGFGDPSPPVCVLTMGWYVYFVAFLVPKTVSLNLSLPIFHQVV